ncbi:hypothetical protein EPUS_09422 [Endocarpon pusillum Z07020]|uniref:HTH psq-type domain-containing protein n=1 Tax=Endocarpon pusillum (strain Z07020 / HMAS-L-300199) TaxID=1263415 RepID=U1GR89_ENDPU|nr:uncharacterized protein EPUS_09422 [Endocarpon pusillum Z07020]ERF74883.1 hypothetical protein EPUS_09422 [Endocarpon pusillum Z07020]
MPVSNEDIDDLVDRAVREIRAAREEGKRSTVVAKARELGIYKDCIHRRLRGDDLVDRAVREIRAAKEEGERSTVAAKARELGIHKDRIHRRLKGIGSRIGRKAANPKLSAIQEASLIRYILSLDEIGHSIQYNQISNIANAILLQDYTTNTPAPSIGSKWA